MLRRPAILFDLDGTLIDSAPDLAASLDATLAAFDRPPVGLEAVRAMVGDGARALVLRGFEVTGPPAEGDLIAQATHYFLDHYRAHMTRLTRPFPGVAESLAVLKAEGARLAVCTNKVESLSRSILADLSLLSYFEAVVGGDSLPVKKPDPGHILGTLSRLAARPSQGVMVGDSANDVNAAKAAGLPVIVVSFGYTKIPASELGGDHLVHDFMEIPALVRGLA